MDKRGTGKQSDTTRSYNTCIFGLLKKYRRASENAAGGSRVQTVIMYYCVRVVKVPRRTTIIKRSDFDQSIGNVQKRVRLFLPRKSDSTKPVVPNWWSADSSQVVHGAKEYFSCLSIILVIMYV